MYIKQDQKKQFITLDSLFVHVANVNAVGDIDLDVRYSIKYADALKQNATKVHVTLFTKHVAPQPVLQASVAGAFNVRELITNVLAMSSTAKTAAKQQDSYVVTDKYSDITARVSNDQASPLVAGVPQKTNPKTTLVTTSVDALKLLNDERPTLQHTIMSPLTASVNVTNDIFDMILRDGVDPSAVTDMTHRSMTAYDLVNGFARRVRAPEIVTSPISRYLSFLIGSTAPASTTGDVSPTSYVQTISIEQSDIVTLPVRMHIPASSLIVDGRSTSTVFLKFELVDSKGAILDSVTKELDLTRHVELFFTPKTPPLVKMTRSDIGSHVNLEIKQRDNIASGVRIYQKHVYLSTPDADDYVLFGEYKLAATDNTLLVSVDNPLTSTAIYRIVAISDKNIQGFDFTNIVVKPGKFYPRKHVSLVAQPVNLGLKLEVRGVPDGIVAVQIIRADKTLHETAFTAVGEPTFVEGVASSTQFYTIIDQGVSDGHVYEYACQLIYRTGRTDITSNIITEYIRLFASLVDTKVTNLNVSHLTNEANVTFDITTQIVDTDIDAVKRMLENQGISQFFTDDILRERDKLKQLIAHAITRVDLTTGQREDFGVITTGTFSDLDLRKNASASALIYGHKYRYDISVLLRAPETMFQEFVKTSVDPTTSRSYAFRPAKFLHPITLSQGNIVSAAGLATLHAKSAMVHGQIGALTSIDVTLDGFPAKVAEATATQFDSTMNLVTWHVNGDIDRVDHFIVLKDVNGVRTIVGKAHSKFDQGNCSFIHRLTPRDGGPVSYEIVPIFDDYTIGDLAQTNTVLL